MEFSYNLPSFVRVSHDYQPSFFVPFPSKLLESMGHMITSHGFIIDSPSDARTLRRLIAHPTSADVEIPMYLLAHPMSDQKSATSDVFDSSSDVGLKVAASDQVLATSRRMRLRRGG